MEDFPSKVATETSSAQSQPQEEGNSLRGLAADAASMVDMVFIKSIPAMLMMAEIFGGLIQWALIASAFYTIYPAYGWVMFVAVTLWILTIILFLMLLGGIHRKLPFVPWPLMVMVYNAVATLLYLTAFLANAATVHPYRITIYYGHMGAAAFFGAVVTIAYGASAYFSYLDWKGDEGNAATDTVPS